jgi:DNA-binding beta-propeller fold protein YncE
MFTRVIAGALVAAGVSATLAACSGTPASTSLPASMAQPSARNGSGILSNLLAPATSQVLFVSDTITNAVYEFSADQHNPTLIGKITAGISQPEGLWVDKTGVLYVANVSGGNVAEFKPGESKPFRTIRVGGAQAVAVDSTGTLYVGLGGFEADSVVVFAHGSGTPTRTIHLLGHPSCCVFVGGIAIDGADNMYVQAVAYPHTIGHVFKFAPGSTNGTDLGLQIGIGPGLALDGSGNLYTGDSGSILVFAPGYQKAKRTVLNGLNFALLFTVNEAGALYVANGGYVTGNGFHPGHVSEYLPGAIDPVSTITSLKGPYGVALRPSIL